MELGPFSMNEIESVRELFEAKKVPFEVLIDEDMRDQQMAELQGPAAQSKSMTGQMDLKFIFLEINDSDYDKVKSHLEKYAIMELSDGSFELGE